MDLDNPALADRLQKHKANRARLQEEIAVTTGAVAAGAASITPATLERVSIAIREKLKAGLPSSAGPTCGCSSREWW